MQRSLTSSCCICCDRRRNAAACWRSRTCLQTTEMWTMSTFLYRHHTSTVSQDSATSIIMNTSHYITRL